MLEEPDYAELSIKVRVCVLFLAGLSLVAFSALLGLTNSRVDFAPAAAAYAAIPGSN